MNLPLSPRLPLLRLATAAGAFALSAPALAGYVYTESNAVDGNRILVLEHDETGDALEVVGAVDTGGIGTGAGLGNQGALALAARGRVLLAVNAGSDDVSVFTFDGGMPVLTDVEPAMGTMPVSIAVHGNLVYVLNAGSDTVTGFRLERGGDLVAIPGASHPLSSTGTAPAQVSFSPSGDQLVVTEKATGNVVFFTVGGDGQLYAPNVVASPTPTPFGFAFGRRDLLFVSEADGGAPDASTVSSYRVGDGSAAELLTASAMTTETAACWIVTTIGGRYVYTTNTGSGTITGFRVGPEGTLNLLDADGVTASLGAGSAPIDAVFAHGDEYLYALDGAGPSIAAFALGAGGSLAPTGATPLDAPSVTGLVAR